MLEGYRLGERIYWEEDFKLPSIVKSGKGVEGDFPVSEFHYKIDTNTVASEESGFHIHIYRGKKEVGNAIKYFLVSLKIDKHYKIYERLYECCKGMNQNDIANYFLRLSYEERGSKKNIIRHFKKKSQL